jgi:hypothetical protein
MIHTKDSFQVDMPTKVGQLVFEVVKPIQSQLLRSYLPSPYRSKLGLLIKF